MNIENHVLITKKVLDNAEAKYILGDYEAAIALFGSAYSHVRHLLECSWTMKRASAKNTVPPGDISP